MSGSRKHSQLFTFSTRVALSIPARRKVRGLSLTVDANGRVPGQERFVQNFSYPLWRVRNVLLGQRKRRTLVSAWNKESEKTYIYPEPRLNTDYVHSLWSFGGSGSDLLEETVDSRRRVDDLSPCRRLFLRLWVLLTPRWSDFSRNRDLVSTPSGVQFVG